MVFAESNALYHSDCVTIWLHWSIVNDIYFGISNEFWLSVFVVEPSSNHFFSPRRSSIESFGYYHFLRVDDYGAGAEAVGLAGSSLCEGGLGDESETDRIMKLLDDWPPPVSVPAAAAGPARPLWYQCAWGRPIWRNKSTHPFWCMCMYSEETYSHIQEDMHVIKSAYVHECGGKIQSDTFKYAQDNMCISECIQTRNTVRYKQICTSKTGAYLLVCRLEIHSHTCRYAPLHRCISDCIILYEYSHFKTYIHICTGYRS